MAPFRMPDDLIRAGETSPDALEEKVRGVISAVAAQLEALGVAWDASTSVHLYSGYDLADVVKRQLLAALAITPAHGLVWHDTAPPVLQLELEIDVRRYLREVTLWPRA